MKRGRQLLKWREPKAWRRATATSLGGSLKSYLTSPMAWVLVVLVVGIPGFFSWLGADPEKRLPLALFPLVDLGMGGVLLVFFGLITWLAQKLPTSLAIYERGLVYQTPESRDSIAFDELEGFFFDADATDGQVFLAFCWQRKNGIPGFAVMPESIGVAEVSRILAEGGVPLIDIEAEEESAGDL